MKVIKCYRCKREIPANNSHNRIEYSISHLGRYLDLCDNCYNKLVHFINNDDTLSKVESIIDNWAVDDDEHELLEQIADIINGEKENGVK